MVPPITNGTVGWKASTRQLPIFSAAFSRRARPLGVAVPDGIVVVDSAPLEPGQHLVRDLTDLDMVLLAQIAVAELVDVEARLNLDELSVKSVPLHLAHRARPRLEGHGGADPEPAAGENTS